MKKNSETHSPNVHFGKGLRIFKNKIFALFKTSLVTVLIDIYSYLYKPVNEVTVGWTSDDIKPLNTETFEFDYDKPPQPPSDFSSDSDSADFETVLN